jgi:uncharacterized protein YlxW (UPF0749 family)
MTDPRDPATTPTDPATTDPATTDPAAADAHPTDAGPTGTGPAGADLAGAGPAADPTSPGSPAGLTPPDQTVLPGPTARPEPVAPARTASTAPPAGSSPSPSAGSSPSPSAGSSAGPSASAAGSAGTAAAGPATGPAEEDADPTPRQNPGEQATVPISRPKATTPEALKPPAQQTTRRLTPPPAVTPPAVTPPAVTPPAAELPGSEGPAGVGDKPRLAEPEAAQPAATPRAGESAQAEDAGEDGALPDRTNAVRADPELVAPSDGGAPDAVSPDVRSVDRAPADGAAPPADRWSALLSWRPSSSGTVLIAVLLALFGFTLVVQLRSGNADESLSAARQEDLVRILSDLEAREQRLNDDISRLDETQRQLASGVQGRQAAVAEAERRADELGLLAGTLPASGPGLIVTIAPAPGKQLKAAAVLNAVQELRGAGGEVIQLTGSDNQAVRVVASTSFVDAPDNSGVLVSGTRLSGAFQLAVIGSTKAMLPALDIPGGVVATIENAGGNVTTVERDVVEVTATRAPADLQYARPVS